MKKYLLTLFLCFALLLINRAYSQYNLQITFIAAGTPLAGEDTVYLYSGAGITNPSNHWNYTVGISDGYGKMTAVGQNQWSICIDPYDYYNHGPAGTMPTGSFIYNIDMVFHNDANFSIQVVNNSNNVPFNLSFSPGTPPPFINNSIGQIIPAYQNCTLGVNDIQIATGIMTNFPNPLVEKTKFIYSLKSPGKISLKVYNTIGQIVKTIVKDEFQSPGTHSYNWQGDNDSGRKLFNGVYYYTLSVNDKVVQTNKLIISR